MSRYALAAILVVAFSSQADAQIVGGRPETGTYSARPVLLGGVPHYPYDTGEYALGGFGGLARFRGYFVIPSPDGGIGDGEWDGDTSAAHGPRHRHRWALRIGSFCR